MNPTLDYLGIVEKNIVLDLARLALKNMDICEEIAESYDMSGTEISDLRDKLGE